MWPNLAAAADRKTLGLLEALAKHQPTTYHPIEISQKALDQCSKELNHLDNVGITPLQQPYLEGLLSVVANRNAGERILVLFLGSTIGNFDRQPAERFLGQVRAMLAPGDALLRARIWRSRFHSFCPLTMTRSASRPHLISMCWRA